jgi:hypothetical protein
MGNPATLASFEKELNRLVAAFEHSLTEFKGLGYVEAQLRDDFLNSFFRALGWDLENQAGLIQPEREVEIESRTQIQGRQKRADYLFRADKTRHDKLVGLVEKMLVLIPKLRVAKSDKERATLQNAVTATDRQIDRLV